MSGSRISAIPVAWDAAYPPRVSSVEMKFCRNVWLVLVTVERWLAGGVMLNRSLSVP